MLVSLIANRRLIAQLVRREVIGKYRGSIMGLAWSFLNPLLMLAVYTFVFAVVFQARWGESPGTRSEFAIVLYVGVLLHGVIAECLNRAPSLILSNASYVKRVVFPLEVLAWVALGSSLFHACVALLILLGAQQFFGGGLPATVFYFPLIALPLLLITMGLAWFIAAVGVFVRDIAQMVLVLTTVMLFMAPVFYPTTALPPGMRSWLYLNPLTFIIEQAREVLIWGNAPHWAGLALYTMGSLLVAWIGYYAFQRMRRGFADVL